MLRTLSRELAVAREVYAARSGGCGPLASLELAPSADVVVTRLSAGGDGWSATAWHAPSGTTCTLTAHVDAIARAPTRAEAH